MTDRFSILHPVGRHDLHGGTSPSVKQSALARPPDPADVRRFVEQAARAQAKLFRLIQRREVRRRGEGEARVVDVRLVASTNRPIQEVVSEGRFRHDLHYRLDVLRLRAAPLRERPEDIAPKSGTRATLLPCTLAALAGHDSLATYANSRTC
jgi:hypothetical protein